MTTPLSTAIQLMRPAKPNVPVTLYGCTVTVLACTVFSLFGGKAHAEPLLLSNLPPAASGREPAPNVILSIDNSTSMSLHIETDSETSDVSKRKISVLKNSLSKTFGNGTPDSGMVPDNRIRLAFQAMHNKGSTLGGPGVDKLVLGASNSMKPFSGTHRSNFNTFVNTLELDSGTLSHKMMKNAEAYLNAPKHLHNPWADTPGVTQTTPYLNCRRSYHVFLTDGAWNNHTAEDRTAFGDGVSRRLPDGKSYDKTALTSRVYADAYGNDTARASTLSDYAFSSWSRDLQDGSSGASQRDVLDNEVKGETENMGNSVRPLIRKAGAEVFETNACKLANNCLATSEYWNPKNDPATWQHATLYTIGFGQGAVSWDAPTGTPRAWSVNNPERDTYGGDFSKLVQGEVTWADPLIRDSNAPIRVSELWHMAINGRGKFFPAANADALDAAFQEILGNVIQDTTPPVVSIATNSSRLGTSTATFLAGYKVDRYSGSLISRPLDSVSGAILPTVNWSAGASLDAIGEADLGSRFIFSYDGSVGRLWKTHSTLPDAQQAALSRNSSNTPDGNGQARVEYLRGSRSKEVSKTGGIFRERDSRLGDIVNSNLWYLGKPSSGYGSTSYAAFRANKSGRMPVVYVGANDGMLHGFAAEEWPKVSPTVPGGKEVIAYIPQGVGEGSLRHLTYTNYTHKYYVDGSPITGDAEIGATPTWKTILLGTLGLGGKGYFLLDVSDPAQFTEANVRNLVIADTTATSDPDLGHIVSPPVVDETYTSKSPQITRMNDGRWAAVIGNGVNSSNEAPVLIIQYLDGDKSVRKISVCTPPIAGSTCAYRGANGLATPQLIDLNGDGKVDVAYAGDLKGHVWKFDLSATSSANWKVAFSSTSFPQGRPFFIANQGAQSFTTAPFWMAHPSGGVLITIGTGRNLTDSDSSDISTVQTLYALWDNSGYYVDAANVVSLRDSTPINEASASGVPENLVQQTISSTPLIDGAAKYYASSANRVDYGSKRGWYLNWAVPGQRSLQNIRLYEGQKILVQTTVPRGGTGVSGESCAAVSSPERNFISVFNMLTGMPSATPVFTLADSALNNTNVTTREIAGSGVAILRGINRNKVASSACGSGQTCSALEMNTSRYTGARGNWQQLQ